MIEIRRPEVSRIFIVDEAGVARETLIKGQTAGILSDAGEFAKLESKANVGGTSIKGPRSEEYAGDDIKGVSLELSAGWNAYPPPGEMQARGRRSLLGRA